MPRRTTTDETRLIGFGKWLIPYLKRRGWTVNRLADAVGMDAGHLGKIVKAYEPQYSSYTRPGYENTVLIGELFGDVAGALAAAGYSEAGNVVNENRIEYSTDPDVRTIVEAFQGATDIGRRNIISAAESALEASRRGAIGGRATD